MSRQNVTEHRIKKGTMMIRLKNEDYLKIIEHAKKELPNEACGLIGGVDSPDGIREIKKVYFLTNTDHSNEHFTIDPVEQLSSIKDMRQNNIKPLGNWHSHPESPSRSSEEDIRLAVDKNASYLILSLMDEERPVLNSFHVEKGISEREELEIIKEG